MARDIWGDKLLNPHKIERTRKRNDNFHRILPAARTNVFRSCCAVYFIGLSGKSITDLILCIPHTYHLRQIVSLHIHTYTSLGGV